MAFGNSPAGTITKQFTGMVSTRRLPVAASTNISKGDVVVPNASGDLIVASDADEAPYYVAIEPADNTSGSAGDISAPLAVGGHFVTVVADGVINPGDKVKISATDAGEVVKFLPTTDAEVIAVGIYWGQEGGTIVKATSTPFAETFTDDADFVPVASAQGDIIEIEIKGA